MSTESAEKAFSEFWGSNMGGNQTTSLVGGFLASSHGHCKEAFMAGWEARLRNDSTPSSQPLSAKKKA